LKKIYPDEKEGYYPAAGGQLFRFVHEIKVGDYVAYPSKQDRMVHIGEIVGPFKYDPKTQPGYPLPQATRNQRSKSSPLR